MTITVSAQQAPAILGGQPTFPDGLPLMRPTLTDVPGLTRRLSEILESGNLTNGPTVRELEELVEARLGVRHVVAVSSCTSGLMLTLRALNVRGPVVMPSFTFSATAHAAAWAGAEPRFVDVSPDTLCVDPDAVRASLEGASAVMGTHIYGTPCRTVTLQQLADAAGVPLVYDAAHALGSTRRGVPVGRFGSAEVFSLSPTKVVTSAEGGLVATNDSDLASTVRLGRNYGNPGDYDCRFPGLNARMSELHAAVALHSLQFLDANVAQRNRLVELFWTEVAGVPGLRRPGIQHGDRSTYKDLTVIVDRDSFGLTVPELTAALGSEGVETRRYFFPPVHAQRAYRHLPSRSLPVTNALSSMVLSLPLWSHMSRSQMRAVAEAVIRIHTHSGALRRALRSRQDTP